MESSLSTATWKCFSVVCAANLIFRKSVYIVLDDIKSTTLCYVELNEATAEEFADAVMNHYWYQLYIDDLPVWGMVGEVRTCCRSSGVVLKCSTD